MELELSTPQLLKDILVIQEFNHQDSLIFEWDAIEHLSLDDYPNIDLSSPEITFMHGNSIEVDNDNNLLISNRTSNEVFKINRITGEIIWILGGLAGQKTDSRRGLVGHKMEFRDAAWTENGMLGEGCWT